MNNGVALLPADQKQKDAKGFGCLGGKLSQIDIALGADAGAITTNSEIAIILYMIPKKDKALHRDVAHIKSEAGTGLVSILSTLVTGYLLSA
eukprot:8498641-Ditylum_brightwellii.AAC.1